VKVIILNIIIILNMNTNEGNYMYVIDHSPYIVDFRSADELPYEHWPVANIDTRYAPIFLVARFFFPMAPSLDGERAGPLANMLFGTKHGGRHHQ
jgi:hypothetical protein